MSLNVSSFFGSMGGADETVIPQMRIQDEVFQEALKYFKISPNVHASDRSIGVVSIIPFNYSESSHLNFLSQSTAHFKEKATALRCLDRNILLSLAVMCVASTLSFLPFMGLVVWAGTAAFLYYGYQRSALYAEYADALTLLVGACNWSLGYFNGQSVEAYTENSQIRAMMAELYPVLTDIQVQHLIDNRIEQHFLSEQQYYQPQIFEKHSELAPSEEERIALNKDGLAFYRCVYGLNKGKPVDFLDAFLSAFGDLYRLASRGIASAYARCVAPSS